MSRDRDELTEIALRAAAALAEQMLQEAERQAPEMVAKARQAVAQGGHVEIGFALGEQKSLISLGVRDATGSFRALGSVPVTRIFARRH